MKAKASVVISIITLLVIALSGSVTLAAAQTSVTPASPSAATISFFIPIVDKNGSAASSGAAVAPSTSTTSTGSTSTSTSSAPYAPQPGDSLLTRDKVFLNFSKSRIIVTSSNPLTAEAYLVGNLPDPCHLLRITSSRTATNVISISVYSLVKPGTACITVLKPFAVTYPLGTFAAGQYSVVVNGTRLGTFGSSIVSSSSGTK